MKCEIEAHTMVNPTENLNKVIEALSNIFEYEDLLISEDKVTVTGSSSSLLFFKEYLEKRQIRDSAHKIISNAIKRDPDKIRFKLSKQAAFAGRINLVEDDLSPLGEIEVEIYADNPEEFVRWLCGQ